MLFDKLVTNISGLKERVVTALLLGTVLTGTAFLVTINVSYASTTNQYRLDFEGDTYVIDYQIENATLDNIEVNLEKQGLQIGIEATSEGSLTITLPRNLIDSKCGAEDLPFIIMMNDRELITGISDATEVAASAEDRTISLSLPDQTKDIFVGAFSLPSLSSCNSLSLIPDEQENGITYDNQDSLDVGNIEVDKEGASIVISLANTTIRDGYLRLELARAAIDSRSDVGDDMPFVITYSDSTQSDAVANYYEIEKNNEVRTLLVELPAGYKELTISGTQVIPEFPIVQLVIAVSIASLVVVISVQNKFWKKY